MKIGLYFRSLTDWSNATHAEGLMRLFQDFQLHFLKMDEVEPIRQPYTEEYLRAVWRGRGVPGSPVRCSVLFRGEGKFKFSGSVGWNRNLYPSQELFNTLYLDVRTPKHQVDGDYLLSLGDALFAWSKGVYGKIDLDHRDVQLLAVAMERRDLIPGLFWVNYFGPPYLSHPEFTLPWASVPVAHGVRVQLTSDITDARLGPASPKSEVGETWLVRGIRSLKQSEFLEEEKRKLGQEWFATPRTDTLKKPAFDFSAVQRS